MWFIHLTVATCHAQYTFLSLCQFENTKILEVRHFRMIRNWPSTVTRHLEVDANRRNFAKPELAYGLEMGGQTDSQTKSQKKSQEIRTSVFWVKRFQIKKTTFHRLTISDERGTALDHVHTIRCKTLVHATVFAEDVLNGQIKVLPIIHIVGLVIHDDPIS